MRISFGFVATKGCQIALIIKAIKANSYDIGGSPIVLPMFLGARLQRILDWILDWIFSVNVLGCSIAKNP